MGLFQGVELDDVRLSGERLLLRSWDAQDADRVFEVMQDRSMSEFLAIPEPYTRADAVRFVTELGVHGRRTGTGLGCAVVERATGRLVGSAALQLTGDPEIGYWIAPDARGRRYAAEATTLLAGWAFTLGLARVRLACDVRNLASARTALAAGFRFEGLSRNGLVSTGDGRVRPRRGDLARFARLHDDPPGARGHQFAELPPAGLTDGVLRLRAMQEDDAPALAETDDELTLRWSFTGAARPIDEVRRAAARAGLDWLVGGVAVFAMEDIETGRFAGSLRLRQAGPPQVGGVGYVVHPAFRGRGYTIRALRLLVPWAFDIAGFARLELGAKAGNAASLRAAAAAGFQPDGLRRCRLRNPDGSFADELRYCLLNPRYV